MANPWVIFYWYAGTTVTHKQSGTIVFEYNEKNVKLQVWDTPGDEQCFEVLKDRYTLREVMY